MDTPHPLRVFVKFWYSPSETLLETGTPSAKGTYEPPYEIHLYHDNRNIDNDDNNN